MTIADEARENAVPCEMVLYAYRKNKEGVVVSFVVHPDDMPSELATARIGSRWVGALVHVGDDEQPVRQPAKEKQADIPKLQPDSKPRSAGAIPYRDKKPQNQAGIRCDDPIFSAFLKETRPDDWHEAHSAADCVRLICGVASRSELETNHKARVIWHQLDSDFQTWLAKQRVGA